MLTAYFAEYHYAECVNSEFLKSEYSSIVPRVLMLYVVMPSGLMLSLATDPLYAECLNANCCGTSINCLLVLCHCEDPYC
jgi:hypothetical protein